MSQAATLERMADSGIVAVLRGDDGGLLIEVAEALLRGGVVALEVTFTVPGAHRVIERMADVLGDRVLLGAGTVLDPETARVALLAGAEFIVSPTFSVEVVRLCRRYSKAVIPGALTPTEVLAAWEAGADVVKVFPSDITGPAYLKALAGPLPQIRLMPTGGVNLDTAASFLRAGAFALGVGSSLVDVRSVSERNFAQIETLAGAYVNLVATTRAKMAEER